MREITMDKNTIRETVRMIASDQSVISVVGVTVSRKDTKYINEWSLGLDIKILFKTVMVVLKKEGSM